jgi:hypothetical protein
MCWRSYLRVPQMEEPRRCLQLFEIRWVFLYDSYEFLLFQHVWGSCSAGLVVACITNWGIPTWIILISLWHKIMELKCNSWACGIQGHFSEQHIQLYGFLLQCAMWTMRFSFSLGSRSKLAFHRCHSKGVFATEIPSSANCHLLNSSLFCNGPAHKRKMQVFTTWLVLEHMQLNNYKRTIICQLHGWIAC